MMKWILTLLSALALVASAVLWVRYANSPDRVFERAATAIEARDWSTLYGLGSEQERGNLGASESQFASLMADLASPLPQDIGARKIISAGRRATRVTYSLEYANLPKIDSTTGKELNGPRVHFPLTVRKEEGRWTLDLLPIVFAMNSVHPDGYKGALGRLLSAMESGNVSRLQGLTMKVSQAELRERTRARPASSLR